MSRLVQLINEIREGVDDIEKALRERMVDTKNIPLGEYGNLIRNIKGESAEPSSSLIILASATPKPKGITGQTIDFGQFAYYIEGYEPIDLAMLIDTMELTDEDYEEMEGQ